MAYFYNGGFCQQSESVFKVPQLPTRLRKPNCNNTQNTYHSTGISTTGKTVTPLDKLEEQISILKKIYPPEDKIWVDVINNVNHLCYVKLSEQILQNNQGFLAFNGPSACPSVYSQNIRMTDRTRNSPSTITNRDCVQENLQPPESCSSRTSNRYVSRTNSIPKSVVVSCRDYNEVATRFCKPKGPLKTSTARNSRRRLPSMNDEIRECDAATSELYVPNVSTKPTKMRQPTNINSIIEISVNKKEGKSNEISNSMKQTIKEDISSTRKLNVLQSEDESDSLTAFFQKRRRPAAKTAIKAPTAVVPEKTVDKRCTWVSDESSQFEVRKRKRSSSGSSAAVKRPKEHVAKPDSTVTEPVIITKKRVLPAANTRTNAGKNGVVSSSKPDRSTRRVLKKAAPKITEKKRSTKSDDQQIFSQPVTAKELSHAIATPGAAFEQLEDNSFFGNVSSIVGLTSCPVTNVKKGNLAKKLGDDENSSLHFFEQFENIRSTSGFSAVSTPLSKSTAKNTLGKRIRKPNVAAELKDQLKPRKPRKIALKAVQSLNNTAATTESECVASDYSDD